MKPIEIIIDGPPQGKGRARAFIRQGRVAHYTPNKTRDYETSIRLAAISAMRGAKPFVGAVSLIVLAYIDIPASWSKKNKRAATEGLIKPTSRPDLDNIVKSIKDGLNGICYRDDAQVCLIEASKVYVSPLRCAYVHVTVIADADIPRDGDYGQKD